MGFRNGKWDLTTALLIALIFIGAGSILRALFEPTAYSMLSEGQCSFDSYLLYACTNSPWWG